MRTTPSIVTLVAVEPGVFRTVDGSQEGELVRFDTDRTGRVTRFRMPGYSYARRESM